MSLFLWVSGAILFLLDLHELNTRKGLMLAVEMQVVSGIYIL